MISYGGAYFKQTFSSAALDHKPKTLILSTLNLTPQTHCAQMLLVKSQLCSGDLDFVTSVNDGLSLGSLGLGCRVSGLLGFQGFRVLGFRVF